MSLLFCMMKAPGQRLNIFMIIAVILCGMPVHAETTSDAGTDSANNVNLSPEKRDPFWPVGYVPEDMAGKPKKEVKKKIIKPSGVSEWSLAKKQIVVSGVSSSSKSKEFFAVVNGKVKRVGDTISVEHSGTIYTWAIVSIKPPRSVSIRRVSAL